MNNLMKELEPGEIFAQPWNERGLPPFEHITTADYEPAILRAIDVHHREIDEIVSQEDAPTFENTILRLERSGELLNRVLNVFYPMLSACADDEMMAISTRLAPLLAEHSSAITLNEELWHRVKWVCDHFDASCHDTEDQMLLKKTREAFERSGATLEGEDREKYRALSKQLTELTLKFEQNHLKATSSIEMWLTGDDLDGLPETAVEAAAVAAKEKGREGEYLITLHAPSYMPFMKYSARRDLRRRLYLLYNTQCTAGEFDNTQLTKDIANTRLAIARLMGCSTYAQYRLQYSMAQTPQRVMDMLEQLKEAYAPAMRQEMHQLAEFAASIEHERLTLMPWDYAYYANKQKEALFDLNDEELRPYFPLESVISGVFGLATRLYGLHFIENRDAQRFNPEVKVYTVNDENGAYVGTLYTDFFPRDTKQSGAWMTNFGEQWADASGMDHRPIVSLTMNFTRPTPSRPSLLTYGEVNTFLHEFGHGLHSLLSRCKYVSTSGTNVYRDFVEMPSQFHENYLRQPDFLNSFARHYLTGDCIPQSLIDKVQASSQYGAGYACLRQLGVGYLDMAWHMITEPYQGQPNSLERSAMKPVQIFEPVDGCMTSTRFGHIFSGGYAAGYYGYKWAEMLDADAFSRMEEEGIFNRDTAADLVRCILSRGSSDEAMTLYEQFCGRPPRIDAMLRRDGIIPQHE